MLLFWFDNPKLKHFLFLKKIKYFYKKLSFFCDVGAGRDLSVRNEDKNYRFYAMSGQVATCPFGMMIKNIVFMRCRGRSQHVRSE